MKSKIRITTGIILFFAVVAVLCSTPGQLFSRGKTIIDTELHQAGDNAIYATTKMDFGNNEHMLGFPNQISEWQGTLDYDWSNTGIVLNADAMLARAYIQPELYQPLFFVIVQSRDTSSFHPPPVCYQALGYEIEEEGTVSVPVTDSVWAAEYWRSDKEGNIFPGELSAKKLIVAKQNSMGDLSERRAVVYYYVKDNAAISRDITMIELSAVAPTSLSPDGVFDQLGSLMASTFPLMFEPRESEDEMVATQLVQTHGFFGWLMIVASLGAPATIIFAPSRRPTIIRKPSLRWLDELLPHLTLGAISSAVTEDIKRQRSFWNHKFELVKDALPKIHVTDQLEKLREGYNRSRSQEAHLDSLKQITEQKLKEAEQSIALIRAKAELEAQEKILAIITEAEKKTKAYETEARNVIESASAEASTIREDAQKKADQYLYRMKEQAASKLEGDIRMVHQKLISDLLELAKEVRNLESSWEDFTIDDIEEEPSFIASEIVKESTEIESEAEEEKAEDIPSCTEDKDPCVDGDPEHQD